MKNIHLKEITIYPLKSARGISLAESVVDHRGFTYDRRWMVVDERGHFLSQRKYPSLALIEAAISSNFLDIKAPEMDKISLPLTQSQEKTLSVQIWKDTCQALFCGEKAAQWISDYLKTPCQIVYMPASSKRAIPKKPTDSNFSMSFADGYPFLLISQESLNDLNERLKKPVLMNRFRPNLVVSGCDAFDEDRWEDITIGEVGFKVAKPCSRCSITTVDQHTGRGGHEPLKTLAKYRKRNRKVYFGQNLIQKNLGILTVNDRLTVIK